MIPSFAHLLWKNAEFEDRQPQIARLRHELGISEIFAQILVARNLYEPQQVADYLYPSARLCFDPALMYGMKTAVLRIDRALKRREKVVIYGDYDVDGTMATVILYRYFRRIGLRVHYYIPERMKTGYGLTEATLRELKQEKAQLIITVDNGSTAVQEARLLRQMGIDLIITDHHQLGLETPEATAILNPQQPECAYPFKGLCGTGVAFKLLESLDRHLTEQGFWQLSGCMRPHLERELDFVAFATIADRAPLVGENRYFVKMGLNLMNEFPRPGFQALMKESNVRGEITPNVVSFKLAPKINAAGRLSDPRTGVRLLLSHSLMEARPYAQELIAVNTERQMIERQVWNSALSLASGQKDQSVIILVDDQWHPGVMGSVAAKIANHFHKTTLALTLSQGNLAVGSVRSVDNFDVCSVLQNCADFLEKFGGHKAAAGLSLMTNNLQEFCKKFQEIAALAPACQNSADSLVIDTWIHPAELSPALSKELMQMSPFGTQNPEPVIGVRNTRLSTATIFGNHLKFILNSAEAAIEIFAWDHSDWYTKLTGDVDLALSPQLHSESCTDTRLQFKVLDIKPAS